jgi:hypothetical protein
VLDGGLAAAGERLEAGGVVQHRRIARELKVIPAVNTAGSSSMRAMRAASTGRP